MKVVALMGSYRRGKTIDTLTDRVLAGAEAAGAETTKIVLVDHQIEHCQNCFTCYEDLDAAIGPCPIEDDARGILEAIDSADGVVLGSPFNVGTITAGMKAMLERATFTLCRPTKRVLWFEGVPEPRLPKRRRAVVLTSAGLIPWFAQRMMIGEAEDYLAEFARQMLDADVVGTLFAGGMIDRSLTPEELGFAWELGGRVAQPPLQPMAAVATRISTTIEPWTRGVGSMVKR